MKTISTLILSTFLLASCNIFDSDEMFDKGRGTEEHPYLISTIDQLQAIGEPEFLDKHFLQITDIDASKSAEFQNGSGFKRIGDSENPFTGSYNGNGFVIHDLHIQLIKRKEHYGFFGYTKNARLENITINNHEQLNKKSVLNKARLKENQYIPSMYEEGPVDFTEVTGYGGLAGVNDGGIILNCHFIGPVSGYIGQGMAGLVGINNGVIENSSFEGRVSGGGVSGLVVWNLGEIHRSHVNASFSGQTGYGFARINEGIITNSSANIDISVSLGATGFVGTNGPGRIESSFAIGTMSSWIFSAGLVINNRGFILDSYSQISRETTFSESNPDLNSVGGLVIENHTEGVIETSYAIGSFTRQPADAMFLTGGVTARNFGQMQFTYWDQKTIDLEHSVGEGSEEDAIGLTTSQMTGPAARENMPEFDWENVWTTTPDGYPILKWQEGDE